MKNILNNWTIKRFIYLLMGIFFIVAGIKDQIWWIIIIGIYALSMSIFGFGCAAGNCGLENKSKLKE
jgi:hypothetical protein